MKIELRSIKTNLAFSEETIMFKAFIYIDGKKAGTAENDGHGGSTYYHQVTSKGGMMLRAAEEYCKSLPKKTLQIGDETHEFEVTLESYIEDLLHDHLEAKSKEKFKKKMQKDMQKGIVVGNTEQYYIIKWKKLTLDQVLNHPQGRASVVKVIADTLAKGERILNTNLPDDIFIEKQTKPNGENISSL